MIIRLFFYTLFGAYLSGIVLFTSSLEAEPKIRFLEKNILNSETGYHTIRWEGPAHSSYVLEKSNDPDFITTKEIYSGQETSLFISGLLDNTYYFRLIDDDGQIHDTYTLKVTHHSLVYSGILFTLGAFIFIAIFIFISRQNTNEK